MQTKAYDIIIVGGGMVGSALACMLAQETTLSIAVLEAHALQNAWSETHYHHRVSAIALSSQRIFKSLQIWESIREARVSPFTQIQVWDAKGQGEIDFDSKEIAEPLLGYIIENQLIQSKLAEKAQQFPHLDFISPVTLKALIEHPDHMELIAQDHEPFTAKCVIAADGADSWLRQKAGIEIERVDYHQAAIVATVETALPHHQVARQVFLDSGPLAFLPLLNEKLSSIVWSLPTEMARKMLECDEAEFQTALSSAFEYRLGDVLRMEKRYAFPLHKQHAKHYVKPRLALIGDAAHTMHPLAGQGVNLGLLDAASLLDVIKAAYLQRKDIGSYAVLRRYERWRKADNLTMLAGVDLIKQLFASEKSSIQTLRSAGLNMTHKMKWIKQCFTRHAVGDRDGLPVMARR